MPIVQNNMDNNADDQLLSMQATIGDSRKYYDDTMKNLTVNLMAMFKSIINQIKISKSSQEKRYSQKSQDTTTVIQAN